MNTLVSKNRQSGMTLIEIMVALVISLFLLAGLLQMFIATRQSARVQENLSRVQENGRFGIEYINRVIRQAGYRSKTTIIMKGKTFKQEFDVNQADGSNDDGYNASDILITRFEGEDAGQGEVRNCLNEVIISPAISTDILSINDSNNLQCQSGGTTQPILENVEDMQILYGERKDGTASGNVAYVPASDIGNWDNVFSIRVSLVLKTTEDLLTDTPQPYEINGVETTPPDRRLYRVFTTTVALRN